jgi:arsenate reductase-like glutaredoxin family protein
LRRRGTPYDDLGLGKPKWTDADLIAAMAKHPLLIERLVVRTRKGTRLAARRTGSTKFSSVSKSSPRVRYNVSLM